MSIETIEIEIVKLRHKFKDLNRGRFDFTKNYVTLSKADEKKLIKLADQIARLYMTRNVMVAGDTERKCESESVSRKRR